MKYIKTFKAYFIKNQGTITAICAILSVLFACAGVWYSRLSATQPSQYNSENEPHIELDEIPTESHPKTITLEHKAKQLDFYSFAEIDELLDGSNSSDLFNHQKEEFVIGNSTPSEGWLVTVVDWPEKDWRKNLHNSIHSENSAEEYWRVRCEEPYTDVWVNLTGPKSEILPLRPRDWFRVSGTVIDVSRSGYSEDDDLTITLGNISIIDKRRVGSFRYSWATFWYAELAGLTRSFWFWWWISIMLMINAPIIIGLFQMKSGLGRKSA